MSGTNFPNGISTRIGGVNKTITGNTTIASVTAADAVTVAVADAVPSAAAPTKAEFDAVVALANDLKAKYNVAAAEANSSKAQLNLVITTLKTAGIIL